MMPDLESSPQCAATTIGDAWQWAAAHWPGESQRGLNELFDRALAISATALRAFPERPLSAAQRDTLSQLIDRLVNGEPLAYVLGRRGFWSLDLEVNHHTLIPRVETERLVELTLERIPPRADWRVVDLGTGSGAIALALAKERPTCVVLGIDKSIPALQVARRNAQAHALHQVAFVASDWLSALSDTCVDLLVSNPPYIADRDPHLSQGDLRFEPATALSSGPDGLDDIRHLIEHAPRCLRASGWLLFEHGFDQGEPVRDLLSARGFQQVQTEQDLEQRDRVSLGQWNGG